MKDFIVREIENKDYNNFLLCLSFESIANYVESIEKDFYIANKTGKILIDQLLVTGNGHNRFISCEIYKGKLNLNSIHPVEPNTMFRELTIQLLKENQEYVKYSILTDYQKKCIQEESIF